MAISLFFKCNFGIVCIIAGLLDGSSEVARQLCHLILPRRLRSVTLRPIFSNGLPFSSVEIKSKIYTEKTLLISA